MNDRELLKLAAKASGELTPSWYGNDAYFEGVLSRWNPLVDDGDALRLAVNLGIKVSCRPDEEVDIWATASCWAAYVQEDARVDKYSAARRAIVRAAAEIGRNMK
jgi:hypothetical protein